MRRSLKICSVLFLSLAFISMPVLFAGCASQGAATVRQAERLISQDQVKQIALLPNSDEPQPPPPAEAPAWARRPSTFAPPDMGPGPERADTSRKHLLELYAGQQGIIERLEGKRNAGSRTNPVPPSAGPSEEGPASDLPPNISQDDLLRILGQQQKLIKALTDRNAKRDGRRTTGR